MTKFSISELKTLRRTLGILNVSKLDGDERVELRSIFDKIESMIESETAKSLKRGCKLLKQIEKKGYAVIKVKKRG